MPTVLRATAAIALSLLLAACTPAPSPSAAPPSGSAVATPGASALVPSGPVPGSALADALRDAVDIGAIRAGLTQLQDLTMAAGGRRNAGSDGYAAAADFVAGELRDAGFTVAPQPVQVPYFEQVTDSSLEIVHGPGFEDLRDFKAMLFSGSGDVMGPIVTLGFDPNALSGSPTGLGCDPAEWSGIAPGSIVLVQPAPCRRQQVVINAQEAGAAAIVTSYVDWERDHVLRPTLVDPASITIPALGATHEVGLALADAAAKGQAVHVAVNATVEMRSSPNVIAESPGGDPAHVVMLGGHLDSVMDGPGMNDDGSGTMTVLELARRLATLDSGPGVAGGSGWKVRVAFWSGEELGLFGSFAYTGSLGADADSIEAYLNFDMLGSVNGVREVYSGEQTQRAAEAQVITDLFGRAFDEAGLTWEPIVIGAASDHFPFEQVGVPTGGLFSGANERKTPDQAARFGGTADSFADPCYHLACDTVDNVDFGLLEQMARAAGWVTGALASGEVALG
jgi:Zn-dependent M28 family amino/carboxypeptidase